MAVPIALAGAGKLAMQVLPFLPGIASAVQGDYGKGAAQAATAYGLGKVPGMGKLAGMGPLGQAAGLGIQTLGGQLGGGMISDIVGKTANAAGGALGLGESAALQRGQGGLFSGPAAYGGVDQMISDATAAARAGNVEQLRALEAQFPAIQKYRQAEQQRAMQVAAQQANLRGQLDRQAGAINMANAGMQQSAQTQRALLTSSNPYMGKIF